MTVLGFIVSAQILKHSYIVSTVVKFDHFSVELQFILGFDIQNRIAIVQKYAIHHQSRGSFIAVKEKLCSCAK